MEDFFEGFSEEITKWEDIRDIINVNLDGRRNDHKIVQSVQLLPRRDVMLYGTIPKMEQRVFTKCKECRLVFNPRDILLHKTCSERSPYSTAYSLKKKVKSKSSSTKKSHSNLPPPPLFKKSPLASSTASVSIPDIPLPKLSSSKISKLSTISSTSSTVTTTSSSPTKSETRLTSSTSSSKSNLHSPKSPSKSSISASEHSPKHRTLPGENNPSSSSSSRSRHKKSRKSNSNIKITKEFDPDVHCGVVEGNKGPCTRSITCSNHRIQLRKLVAGRSKDIHQLITEKKTVKEKELKHGSNCSYTSPNGRAEEKDAFSQITTYVPAVAAIANGSALPDTASLMPILRNIRQARTLHTTSVVAAKQLNLIDRESIRLETMHNNYRTNMHKQERKMGGLPVFYMPTSLISFMQLGKHIMCLQTQSKRKPVTTQSLFLSIPTTQHLNTKAYKSLPKPVAVPNYGGKKVGGAILLSNQRIECQRNDILMAINTKLKTINNTQGYRAMPLLNHTNTPRKPNILKVNNVNKENCKRISTDKPTTCDSKQLRLTKLVGSFRSPI